MPVALIKVTHAHGTEHYVSKTAWNSGRPELKTYSPNGSLLAMFDRETIQRFGGLTSIPRTEVVNVRA